MDQVLNQWCLRWRLTLCDIENGWKWHLYIKTYGKTWFLNMATSPLRSLVRVLTSQKISQSPQESSAKISEAAWGIGRLLGMVLKSRFYPQKLGPIHGHGGSPIAGWFPKMDGWRILWTNGWWLGVSRFEETPINVTVTKIAELLFMSSSSRSVETTTFWGWFMALGYHLRRNNLFRRVSKLAMEHHQLHRLSIFQSRVSCLATQC